MDNNEQEAKTQPTPVPEYIERIFVYHKPQGDQAARYETLRAQAKNLAIIIHMNCPESRERSLAITKLQECVMFANASIAINE